MMRKTSQSWRTCTKGGVLPFHVCPSAAGSCSSLFADETERRVELVSEEENQHILTGSEKKSGTLGNMEQHVLNTQNERGSSVAALCLCFQKQNLAPELDPGAALQGTDAGLTGGLSPPLSPASISSSLQHDFKQLCSCEQNRRPGVTQGPP